MSYSTLYQLAKDEGFLHRVTACAATQGITQADRWAEDNRWSMAAQPGFEAQYDYAVNTSVPDPGKNVGVINDEQILSAVQAVLRGN
ncbi:hypothetical protein FCN77_16290 [Arthrobacter sp. 24S4-2]|uniref:hypothetical protein n=1 Tax=Arthrobacter sp. 24S4-2 TaxID=2575374 RepID=UPI0010C7DDA1|nr:hypothetical protein [Arthrobacter sp. 24S4-2]QCO98974.1 hypothetical protein FCN77_16290 [Arthrobacter sp. 24S4-2]